MLRANNFYPYLDKIALSLQTTERSSSKSSSGSLSGLGSSSRVGYIEDRNLQETIGEARRNANLQPLNRKNSKPLDFPSAKEKTRKNMKMSHLNDRRLLNQNYGSESRLRAFSRKALPKIKSVI